MPIVVPLAQGQVTGAVAMMLQKPATRTTRKRRTTKKRATAARKSPAKKRAAPRRTKGRLKKGSPAAKRRMAQLRRMKAKKR